MVREFSLEVRDFSQPVFPLFVGIEVIMDHILEIKSNSGKYKTAGITPGRASSPVKKPLLARHPIHWELKSG